MNLPREPTESDPMAAPPPGPADARQTVTIRCREHGPLVVELPADEGVALRVTDHTGNEFPLPTEKRLVALCRCGRTGSRPFCDGSHKACGFSAADLALPPGTPAEEPPCGP